MQPCKGQSLLFGPLQIGGDFIIICRFFDKSRNRKSKGFWLVVPDDGCGIPRERLKTLFSGTGGTDPDVPADSRKHGMGIGLSVCAAIIKAHGGEIKAESTPGEGTTIRFWLETEEVDTEETEDEQ